MSGLRIICIILLVTFTAAVSLNAREPADDTFITLLKVQYTGGIVTVRFETIQNEDVQYRIYRSTSTITAKPDLADARLAGEIGSDELPFTDRPERDGKYYYMVSVVKDDIEYFSFIPYQNTTLTPIDFAPVPDPVQSVTVQKLQDTALIRYSPVRKDYTYRLYVQDRETMDLSGLSPRTEMGGDRSGFRVAFKESQRCYFYVTTVNRLGVENRSVLSGVNTAVLIPVVRKIIQPKPKPPTNREFIDRNLRTNFYKARYSTALDNFKKIERNRNLRKRELAEIHFYSAQCLFYLGDYKGAIKLFIQGKEEGMDSGMSDAWIQRCLDKID